jgi:hypothetical protein
MQIRIFDSSVGNWKIRLGVENERIAASNDIDL